MARRRYPRSSGPLPPPLPPETRTVGQLVAETLKLYGTRFWLALPLGLVVAAADQVSLGRSLEGRIAVLFWAAPFFSVAYAAAAVLASGDRRPARTWARATVLGTVVFVPAAIFFPWFALAAIAWLAVFGNVVPAVMMEQRPVRGALARALEVARADLVHAVGGLATLALLFGMTRLALGFVLRSQADNTVRTSVFLADTVLAPTLLLGGALLFVDLRARVGSPRRRTRRADAAVPDADDAH
jgi:hypothetical protein